LESKGSYQIACLRSQDDEDVADQKREERKA
jgi:hypothetical protein